MKEKETNKYLLEKTFRLNDRFLCIMKGESVHAHSNKDIQQTQKMVEKINEEVIKYVDEFTVNRARQPVSNILKFHSISIVPIDANICIFPIELNEQCFVTIDKAKQELEIEAAKFQTSLYSAAFPDS